LVKHLCSEADSDEIKLSMAIVSCAEEENTDVMADEMSAMIWSRLIALD